MLKTANKHNLGYVITLATLASFGSFYLGYEVSVLAVFQNDFSIMNIDVSADKSSILITILPFCAAIGGLLAGPLTELGRRKALIMTDILGILGPICENLPGYYAFLTGRVLCGLVIGLYSSIVPLHNNEISPVALKGTIGTFHPILISVGVLVGYVMGLGPITSDPDWWRIMMAIPGVLSAIRLVFSIFVFKLETPLYSMKVNDEKSAMEMINKIYSENQEFELEKCKKDAEIQFSKGKVTYKELFSSKLRRRLSISCFLSALQQLSGINSISYSATSILGGSQTDACLVGVAGIIGSILAILILSKYGRRSTLMLGTGLCAILLMMVAFGKYYNDQMIQYVSLFGFLIIFSVSLGPIFWMYSAEILPDVGMSVTAAVNWLVSALVVQVFLLFEGLGPWMFAIFALFCLLGLVFEAIFVEETRGKTSQEINAMFSDKKETEEISNSYINLSNSKA